MTRPQERAAKAVKYRESGGTGFTPVFGEEVEYGCVARGMKEATTREHTYNTIWMVIGALV